MYWMRDDEQKRLCEAHGAGYVPCLPSSKVGIARNVREGLLPLNGLRINPVGDTNGWYIWAGPEMSQDPGFFVPLHVEHLKDWCPEAIRFLGLPPGWRFLVAGDQQEVWEDVELLSG